MTNHTTGPWKCDGTTVNGRGEVKDKTGSRVSFDIYDATDWPGDEDEGLANAHLISAAPEMLEMLEMLLDRNLVTTVAEISLPSRFLDRCREVVAKAKGESC